MVAIFAGLSSLSAFATSTIDETGKYSWGPNIGWLNWEGDVDDGVAFGETFASGFIYSGNVGWISLGDGPPSDGVYYSNATADDFGVNVDSVSDRDFFLLSGFG